MELWVWDCTFCDYQLAVDNKLGAYPSIVRMVNYVIDRHIQQHEVEVVETAEQCCRA